MLLSIWNIEFNLDLYCFRYNSIQDFEEDSSANNESNEENHKCLNANNDFTPNCDATQESDENKDDDITNMNDAESFNSIHENSHIGDTSSNIEMNPLSCSNNEENDKLKEGDETSTLRFNMKDDSTTNMGEGGSSDTKSKSQPMKLLFSSFHSMERETSDESSSSSEDEDEDHHHTQEQVSKITFYLPFFSLWK